MKKILPLILLISLTILSCDATDDVNNDTGTVAVYIIDYTTGEFQSGATLSVNKAANTFTTIPVSASITQPVNDLDGSVSLALSSTGDQLFDGELSDEGTARIFAPALLSPALFFKLETPLEYPSEINTSEIEGPYDTSFETLWASFNDLSLTKVLLDQDAFFGHYLYQPSPDVSDQWKWVIMIYTP